jgi:hypothetical protein
MVLCTGLTPAKGRDKPWEGGRGSPLAAPGPGIFASFFFGGELCSKFSATIEFSKIICSHTAGEAA